MTDSVKRLFRNRQMMVADNMRNMLQDTPTEPVVPPAAVLILRAKLMLEEVLETIVGLGVTVTAEGVEICKAAKLEFKKDKPVNIFEVVDGLADLDYVGPCGTAVAFGVDLDPIFNEVHRSNMSKCWTDMEVAHLTQEQADYQVFAAPSPVGDRKWVVLDASGKYVKSPSYSPADIQGVMKLQFA